MVSKEAEPVSSSPAAHSTDAVGGRLEDDLAFLDNEVLVDVCHHDKEQGRETRVEGNDKFRVGPLALKNL